MSGVVLTLRAGVPEDLDMLVSIDDDASQLFVRAGFDVDLPATHEFTVHERTRWRECLAQGTVVVAMRGLREPVGFAAVSARDGDAFLQQISVRQDAMRQGIGAALLEVSMQRARRMGSAALWLTTYSHLAWNRPFYEKHGFVFVPEEECSAGLRGELAFERRWLPYPEQRVAMRRTR